MQLPALLKLLADGEFHSGAELGEVLGVSRTAVWKHLKKLQPLGLTLTSVKGRGYRLEGGLDLLDAEQIQSSLSAGVGPLLGELDIQALTDSTNTQALAKCSLGDARGYVCLAEQQSAGKGRRGREWVSPFGRNIYLSLVWGFDGGVAALEGLSLAVGSAIVSALEAQGIQGLGVKWPNDILWAERKLAGILLEMTGDVDGRCQVVVGIGLNVSMPSEAGVLIDQAWVDVGSIVNTQGIPAPGRNTLVAGILNEVLPMLSRYEQEGFAAHRLQWEARDAFRDAQVVLSTASESFEGRARGVAGNGALKIEIDGAIREFNGGEVSLRVRSDSE